MSGIDSSQTAKKRLINLGRKMQSNQQLGKKIYEKMEKLICKGYVERVPAEDCGKPGLWFLPLHPVVRKKKLRLTHDAAAKTNGKSLNDFLLKGPDLVCSLVQTLLAGRLHPVIFKADVEEFFLRVKMAVEDINAFTF